MSESSVTFPTLEAIESKLLHSDFPEFRAGDKLRVHVRIDEGDKERIQVFEGVCIQRSHRGKRGSFTVRKMSHGVGVERVWSVNSPRVTKIDMISRGVVRRAKLYYLRGRSGNSARIREKIGGYKSARQAAK
ncbi:MAG: 50S ribosomal protein L19 [Nannocystaceae bacterium]